VKSGQKDENESVVSRSIQLSYGCKTIDLLKVADGCQTLKTNSALPRGNKQNQAGQNLQWQ
jgi:hypothetical protein